MIGCGIGAGGRARGFDPAALFGPGVAGAVYEPRPGLVFQDTAGTVPAGIGDPVGRLLDRSGGGNHAVQPAAARRPILRRDPGGAPFLEFDGIDDFLQATFACPQPFERVSAIRLLARVRDAQLIGGGTANVGVLVQHEAVPQWAMFAGAHLGCPAPAVGQDAVAFERFDGATSRIAVNGGASVAGAAGTASPGGITLGAHFIGAAASAMRLHATAMIGRLLNDDERTAVGRWAQRAGGATW